MEPPPTKMEMQEAQTGIFAVPVAMGTLQRQEEPTAVGLLPPSAPGGDWRQEITSWLLAGTILNQRWRLCRTQARTLPMATQHKTSPISLQAALGGTARGEVSGAGPQ